MASITIVSPSNTVTAGEKGKVNIAVSQSDFYTMLQSVSVVFRDSNGEEVWRGSSRFHRGTAEINAVWPSKCGVYTIQSDAYNFLGQVVCLATGQFNVVEKSKTQEEFSIM